MADSSFITKALLVDRNLIEDGDEPIISPALALYEVTNNIWKHEVLLKDILNGSSYISILSELVDSGKIVLLHPNLRLMEKTYEIAKSHKVSIHDAVFLALALETGFELKSFDSKMNAVFKTLTRIGR